MKVPANLSGERLIREYLSRLTEAATRYLPKGRRIAFVGSTRNRIERECVPAVLADPERVRDVLARLGEPEDLVKAERARLDAELLKRQGAAADTAEVTMPLQFRPINSRWKPATQARPARRPPPAGQGDAGPDRPPGRRGAAGEGKRKGRLGGLLGYQPGRSGAQTPQAAAPRSPAGTVGQPPDSPAGQQPDGRAGQQPGGRAGQQPGGRAGQQPGGRAGQQPDGTAGQPPAGTARQQPAITAGQGPGEAARWTSGGAGTQLPGGAGTQPPGGAGTQPPGGTGTQPPGGMSARAPGAGGSEPAQRRPAGWVTPAAAGPHQAGGSADPSGGDTPAGGTPVLSRGPYTLRGVMAALGRGAAQLALDAAKVARRYPLESAAVIVLGVGGLIFPPLWLLGGLLAIGSRIWNNHDKWIALAGPPVIALIGTVVTAVIIGGRGHAVAMYPHAFAVSVGDLLSAGSVLCAGYLVLQGRRGPQRRLPPWRR